jgi:His-Xaa-Ser system radical SAM maturase HxsC
MIKLHSKENHLLSTISHESPFLAKVTTNHNLIKPLRSQFVLIWNDTIDHIPEGFLLVLIPHDYNINSKIEFKKNINVIVISKELNYLTDDDVIKFYPNSCLIDVLYRRKANSNSFLVTERCNSFCIMCSQPPRDIDDSYRVSDILNVMPLIHTDTVEICITGGETTLIGDDFTKLIQSAKIHLPSTALHILSNGRNFQNINLAISVAKVNHHDLMIGIPLYADYSQLHDFIVQADNAFDETIRGILNLKRCRVPVEIRVVIHAMNYERLPKLAEFIARNLLFVDHIALMGLEFMGFAKTNLNQLWIDPYLYQNELEEAVNILARNQMNVSIYNTPLCLIPNSIRKYSTSSISDWKNDYLDECINCTLIDKCGGFFSSNLKKVSEHISPII